MAGEQGGQGMESWPIGRHVGRAALRTHIAASQQRIGPAAKDDSAIRGGKRGLGEVGGVLPPTRALEQLARADAAADEEEEGDRQGQLATRSKALGHGGDGLRLPPRPNKRGHHAGHQLVTFRHDGLQGRLAAALTAPTARAVQQ